MRANPAALKVIRQRTGESLANLSRSSGVDRTVLTRLEKGERRGTPAQLRALAEALHVPVTAIALFEQEDVA